MKFLSKAKSYFYAQRARRNARAESGRSMVEMLGVLAIIGVITVGAMIGYRYAMERIMTNSIITGVRARAVVIGQQRVLGQPLNLSEFHPDTEKDLIYGHFEVKAFNNYVYDGEERQALEVYNIPKRVCEKIQDTEFPDDHITLVNKKEVGDTPLSCIPDGPTENTGNIHDAGDYFTAEYHNTVTFVFMDMDLEDVECDRNEQCAFCSSCIDGLCIADENGARCGGPSGGCCMNGRCLPLESPACRCITTYGDDPLGRAYACCLEGYTEETQAWTCCLNPDDAVCQEPADKCAGQTCSDCMRCNSDTGTCVLDATQNDQPCGSNGCSVCENGSCLNKMTQIKKCDGTQENCCPLTATCTNETNCPCDPACGACERCVSGSCVPDLTLPGCTKCHADTDCSGGACCCADGTCSADCCNTKCDADTDCSGGACCCADGTCSADCCTTKCHADTDCSGGACCCTDGTCSADCCNTKCHADTDCSGGTCCCTDGTCSADCCGTPCSTDENCHYCEQCINERCVPNDNKMCYVDGTGCAMCQGGKCVKRPTKPIKLCNGKIEDCCLYYDNSCEDETGCCTSDAQCDKEKCMKCDPTTKKCNQYKKWVRDCNGKPRTCCQDDETCKDGICVIKCATDADCGAGNTCCSGVCVLAGSGSQCCGGRIVSADLECCGDRIVDKEKGDECCGGKNLCTNGQWCDGKECAGKMTCTSNGMMNPHRGEPGYVSLQECCQTDDDCTTLEKSSDCPFKCEGNECRAHKKGDGPCFNCNATTGEKEPLSVGYPIGKCLVCRMVNGQIAAVDTTTEGCCWNDEMCQNRNNDKCLRCTSQEETIVGTCVQKDDYEKCSCEANQGTWEDNKCSFSPCPDGYVWDTSDEAKNYTGTETHVPGEGACCPETNWNTTYNVCCRTKTYNKKAALNYWSWAPTKACCQAAGGSGDTGAQGAGNASNPQCCEQDEYESMGYCCKTSEAWCSGQRTCLPKEVTCCPPDNKIDADTGKCCQSKYWIEDKENPGTGYCCSGTKNAATWVYTKKCCELSGGTVLAGTYCCHSGMTIVGDNCCPYAGTYNPTWRYLEKIGTKQSTHDDGCPEK